MMNPSFGTSPTGDMQFCVDGMAFCMGSMARQGTPSMPPQPTRSSVGPMRIIKPKSASNSPRDAWGLARRRSVLNDDTARRRAVLMEQQLMAGAGMSQAAQFPAKSSRPMSWHPSSSRPLPQPYLQPSPYRPSLNQHSSYTSLDMSPSMTAYSAYTSPVSAISPISLPYNEYDLPSTTSLAPPYPSNIDQYSSQQYASFSAQHGHISYATDLDWNHFLANGFDATGPPTPDPIVPIQSRLSELTAGDTAPYQTIVTEEDSGEELIGMGLYDDVVKSPPSRLGLDPYQTMMTPQLLGSIHSVPELRGKRLKLEETWVPPADQEGGDDQDDQDDEEEEETDERIDTRMQQIVQVGPDDEGNCPQQGMKQDWTASHIIDNRDGASLYPLNSC